MCGVRFGVLVFLLEEPSLSQRVGVNESRAVLHLLVLSSDSAGHRAVDLTGRLDGLHRSALLPHLQAGQQVIESN